MSKRLYLMSFRLIRPIILERVKRLLNGFKIDILDICRYNKKRLILKPIAV